MPYTTFTSEVASRSGALVNVRAARKYARAATKYLDRLAERGQIDGTELVALSAAITALDDLHDLIGGEDA